MPPQSIKASAASSTQSCDVFGSATIQQPGAVRVLKRNAHSSQEMSSKSLFSRHSYDGQSQNNLKTAMPVSCDTADGVAEAMDDAEKDQIRMQAKKTVMMKMMETTVQAEADVVDKRKFSKPWVIACGFFAIFCIVAIGLAVGLTM